ncbi:hypothetical protein AC481_01710 [miscellaneous Crenarchaeota group archaeon SMTZ-80]|nr:MAG: hypothetical protein AC481_01710 [miscellaneous Crenarchaeota group archaeon SMTZ-80]
MIANEGFCNDFIDFLKLNHAIKNANELILIFDSFIKKRYPSISHTVLEHMISPNAYHIIFDTSFSREVCKKLMEYKHKIGIQHNKFIRIDELSLFIVHDSEKNVRYLVIFKKLPSADEKPILNHCENLQYLFYLMQNQESYIERIQQDIQANLVSHINHDFNSLISLVRTEALDKILLEEKLSYSQHLINQLLLYIRETDVMKSHVPVKELIEAVLHNHPVPNHLTFTYAIEENLQSISVDVELIDQAIAAILDNAIRATAHSGGDIILTVRKIENYSIFYDNNWLMISITDHGSGIPEDYLNKVKDPFFTTYKSQGHTGFGLTIAQKIIEVHSGILNIQQVQPSGTEVIIYLPL